MAKTKSFDGITVNCCQQPIAPMLYMNMKCKNIFVCKTTLQHFPIVSQTTISNKTLQ